MMLGAVRKYGLVQYRSMTKCFLEAGETPLLRGDNEGEGQGAGRCSRQSP
jgi:hypothetical protein